MLPARLHLNSSSTLPKQLVPKHGTFAPPKLGDDEELEVVVGKGVTLNCDVEQEGLQSTITWLANQHAAAPPQFRDKEYTDDIQLTAGTALTLTCYVDGSPQPAIKWLRDGRVVNEAAATLSDDDQKLIVQHSSNANHRGTTLVIFRYACLAGNKAGTISREFSVQPDEVNTQISLDKTRLVLMNVRKEDEAVFTCVAKNSAGQAAREFELIVLVPPRIVGKMVEDVVVIEGESLELECDFEADPMPEIFWFKDGTTVGERIQLLNEKRTALVSSAGEEDAGSYRCAVRNKAGRAEKTFNVRVLNGGRHLLISSVAPHDEAVYTCVARNQAGQARKNFKLSVLGLCLWNLLNAVLSKDGRSALSLPLVQTLSEGQQFKIISANAQHRGSYMCTALNKVGKAEISFDVDVIKIAEDSYGSVRNRESAHGVCISIVERFRADQCALSQICTLSRHSELRDEGSYSCRVKNDAGESRVDYKLLVLVPPEIIMLDKDKNRTAIENSTVLLSCPVTGKPEPTIEWYRDGELLKPENITRRIRSGRLEGNDLRIVRIQVGDTGRYTCEARNKAGLAEQDVLIYVMTPPRIEREGVPSEIGGKSRSTVTISCPAYGRPPPAVTWLKAGRPLEYSPEVYLSANGMKLHFIDLKKEHADRYTCIARNLAGEDKRDFSLKMLEAPTIEGPNILRKVQVNAGRASIINCPVMGSPEPSIAWLKNGQPLATDERHVLLNGGRQLQISDTTLHDDARYTCIATNNIGLADLETYLQVIGGPVIAGDKLETVEVLVNEPHDLECEVSGTEPMDIEWQRGGQTIDFGGIRGGSNYMQVADTGRFSCVSRNSAGEARKSYDLKVLGNRFLMI
uniref:Ig-like domain-containing protein n=1 Tax=Parascaris equorum TaxID=6256 RepID=A0A914RG71_PAREQ